MYLLAQSMILCLSTGNRLLILLLLDALTSQTVIDPSVLSFLARAILFFYIGSFCLRFGNLTGVKGTKEDREDILI
jgi:hypothetical protein